MELVVGQDVDLSRLKDTVDTFDNVHHHLINVLRSSILASKDLRL